MMACGRAHVHRLIIAKRKRWGVFSESSTAAICSTESVTGRGRRAGILSSVAIASRFHTILGAWLISAVSTLLPTASNLIFVTQASLNADLITLNNRSM